mgnify:CR=1 FL=1
MARFMSPLFIASRACPKNGTAALLGAEVDPAVGYLILGDDDCLYDDVAAVRAFLYPEDKFADFAGPLPKLPRSGSHEREWIAACKGGAPGYSDFDVAAYLTEIILLGCGEIGMRMQIDLLRVLEDRVFYRVGGTQPIEADFRVVAASNRDLLSLVETDDFRSLHIQN